jgi:uroporphyrin-III C-methyltransferase/precorrin-2 dehydrogenase/sirohydrochlorin ferrochelatase
VIYMGAGRAAEISASLIRAGKSATTPVVMVENASLPGSSHVSGTLSDLPRLAALGSGGPALILVGEVYREIASRSSIRHERLSA